MKYFIIVLSLSLSAFSMHEMTAAEVDSPRNSQRLKRRPEGSQQREKRARRDRIDFESPYSLFQDELAEQLESLGYKFMPPDSKASQESTLDDQRDIFDDERLIAMGSDGIIFKMRSATGQLHAVKCPILAVKLTEQEKAQLQDDEPQDPKILILKSRVESYALQSAKQASHVIDCVEHIQSPFGTALVLPYFSQTLADLLEQDRPLSFEELDLVAKALLGGLAELSACGEGPITIVHGDIKPANILIAKGEGGVVAKLADFGRAMFLDEEGKSFRPFEGIEELDRENFGSSGWVAPEVALTDCQEKARFGQKIDVWGAGAVIFGMWTQKRLLEGDGSFNDSIAFPPKILGRPPEDLIRHAQGLVSPGGPGAKTFSAEALENLEEALERPTISDRQEGLKAYLEELNFTGRLLGEDQQAKKDEIELFTSFLAKVLHIDPAKRLTPEEALQAWNELSRAVTERMAQRID